MYKEHYNFHTPYKSLTIWRYIDFEKFIDLLISSTLFFCRSDKFEDPFEGIFRLKDHKTFKPMFSDQQLTKQFYFLNCWHINETQSDAMWKIFLNTKNGIAIKSTVGDLINSLENTIDDINIGSIYYRDFDKVTFDELAREQQNQIFNGQGRSVNQFNYKRISFEHEKELRLYYIDLPIPHTIKNGVPREPLEEKRVEVNLNTLINEVVISPFANDWFKNLVEGVIAKFGLNMIVHKSVLYELKE